MADVHIYRFRYANAEGDDDIGDDASDVGEAVDIRPIGGAAVPVILAPAAAVVSPVAAPVAVPLVVVSPDAGEVRSKVVWDKIGLVVIGIVAVIAAAIWVYLIVNFFLARLTPLVSSIPFPLAFILGAIICAANSEQWYWNRLFA